ncbi:MAG: WYL domain-containing protein, partial [Oscillospiraceae bacterium]|nr:WYL domain-containing protein [Oscillospiraceae bacterium]
MAYSELIKNFERVREYMRDFFVYGFKSRSEYDLKSARSYDNERRRIESWLGGYMGFRQDERGKNVFLSVDSRSAAENPLYKAFKAKSFTAGDITFHFWVLDLLADGRAMSLREISGAFLSEYAARFESDFSLDDSTLRKKLREYVSLGLIHAEKRGREYIFKLSEDGVDLSSWSEALAFFSEADPLGLVGSFL